MKSKLKVFFFVTISVFFCSQAISDEASTISEKLAIDLFTEIKQINDENKKIILIVEKGYSNKSFYTLSISVVAFLTALFVAYKNHSYTKQRKWHEEWAGKLIDINDGLFQICEKIISKDSGISSCVIKLEIKKAQAQLVALLKNPDNSIDKIDKLNIVLFGQGADESTEEIYSILGEITKEIYKEIKNESYPN